MDKFKRALMRVMVKPQLALIRLATGDLWKRHG